MTLAISINVHDGIILSSDSATSLPNQNGEIVKVYNNANKIFNLHRDLPIGSMTWGLGGIGPASISTLSKDLRKRFMGLDKAKPDWALKPESYTMEEVAEKVKTFFYDEKYVVNYPQSEQQYPFGYLITGYSHSGILPEQWLLFASNGEIFFKQISNGDDCGLRAWGEPEIVYRLVRGYSDNLISELDSLLSFTNDEERKEFLENLTGKLSIPLVFPAMPIQDAIELGGFLVDATGTLKKFMPVATTVGGPTEIATITKHKGFKWIQRKHFYQSEYNPHYMK